MSNHLYSRLAIRDGDRYCAPWCGRGCTWKEHVTAVRGATSLEATLTKQTGLAWKARVWENLGWYYAVDFGLAQIYPKRRNGVVTGYTCIVNSALSRVGDGLTPVAAFEDVRSQLREALLHLGRDLHRLGGLT